MSGNMDAAAGPVAGPAAKFPWPTLAWAIAGGLLLGLTARGPAGPGWLFAALLLSAAIVALAQQTLP